MEQLLKKKTTPGGQLGRQDQNPAENLPFKDNTYFPFPNDPPWNATLYRMHMLKKIMEYTLKTDSSILEWPIIYGGDSQTSSQNNLPASSSKSPQPDNGSEINVEILHSENPHISKINGVTSDTIVHSENPQISISEKSTDF